MLRHVGQEVAAVTVSTVVGFIAWLLGLTIPNEYAVPLICAALIAYATAQWKLFRNQRDQDIRNEYEDQWRKEVSERLGTTAPPRAGHHRSRRRARTN